MTKENIETIGIVIATLILIGFYTAGQITGQ